MHCRISAPASPHIGPPSCNRISLISFITRFSRSSWAWITPLLHNPITARLRDGCCTCNALSVTQMPDWLGWDGNEAGPLTQPKNLYVHGLGYRDQPHINTMCMGIEDGFRWLRFGIREPNVIPSPLSSDYARIRAGVEDSSTWECITSQRVCIIISPSNSDVWYDESTWVPFCCSRFPIPSLLFISVSICLVYFQSFVNITSRDGIGGRFGAVGEVVAISKWFLHAE